MLHASVALKERGRGGEGGGIQNIWEVGRTLYEGTSHFMGGLNNPSETMKGATSKEFTSLNVGQKEILTAYHNNE